MTGFEAYRLHLALNNHFFQPSYDYFKYHGGVSTKPETYEKKRSDEKYRYDRLGRKFSTKEELENFIVANLIEAKKRTWVGDLFGDNAEDTYLRWQGRTQSIQYNLISEIKRLVDRHDSFNVLFQSGDGQHPEIIKAQMRRELSLESFVILDICLNFIPALEKKLGDDRNWLIIKQKAIKYRPFLERLNTDKQALKKAVLSSIQSLGVNK